MLIGAIAIFLAVIFGKFEGSLAQLYSAVKPVRGLLIKNCPAMYWVY